MVKAECVASGSEQDPTFEYYAHGEVTDNDAAAHAPIGEVFDAAFGPDSVVAAPSTASEDFCYLPQAWGVPYVFGHSGCTPEDELQDPPVNHQATFLPDYAPTVYASTRAAYGAAMTYLATP